MTKARAPRAPAGTAASVAAGKSRASKSGARGEAIVEAFHQTAVVAAVAQLHKVPTPTRRVPVPGKGWTMIYTKPSTVDMVGFRTRDGAHCALEIKTCTSRAKFYLSEVEPHQASYLTAVEAAGGIAALVVVHGPGREVALIAWAWARERTFITAVELAALSVTPAHYAERLNDWGATRFAPQQGQVAA